MSRRNGIKRRYIVQLWIDPAAHAAPHVPCDTVRRVQGLDMEDAARAAFAATPDCAVADVYADTKAAPYLGAVRVEQVAS